MNELPEPGIGGRRDPKLRNVRRERIVALWVIFFPGLASVAAWVISMMVDRGTPHYFGWAAVLGVITLPWTGISAAFLSGTWPGLRGTGSRRLGVGLLIWLGAVALNGAFVGTVLVAGCAHNWGQSH